MNKQLRYAAGVGFVITLFAAILAGSLIWLRNSLNRHLTLYALFTDAKGISSSQPIQMAGVQIGSVDKVELTPDGKQAKLTLGIEDKYKIPRQSRFQIKASLLGNQGLVSITPANNPDFLKEGDTVVGDSNDPLAGLLNSAPGTLNKAEETMSEVNQTLRQSRATLAEFTRTGRAINKLLAEEQSELHGTLANVHEASNNLPALTRQMQSELANLSFQTNQLLASLQKTQGNANKVINGAASLTDNLNGALTENRKTLKSMLRAADDAANSVAGLTEQLKSTIGDPKIKANLNAATDNLVTISGRLDDAAASLERLTTDPRLSSDLRDTVSNLRDSSASVKDLVGRIQTVHIPGEKRRPSPTGEGEETTPPARPKPLSFQTLYEPGLVVAPVYDTKLERLRLNADYTLLSGPKNGFYRLGLTDITERNGLDLQLGRGLNSNATYRYGILAGKLGGGFDLGAGPLALRFDFYDPNRFTINGRVRAYLNPTTAITAGVDSVGKGNRATVGIQIKR